MTERKLKTVQIIFQVTFKTVSQKQYINIENKSQSSEFSYAVNVYKKNNEVPRSCNTTMY